MLRYSAINRRTNNSEEYSTLNPLTSSDSPSTKSKGVRLVSAKILTIHNINKGKKKKNSSKSYIKYKKDEIKRVKKNNNT